MNQSITVTRDGRYQRLLSLIFDAQPTTRTEDESRGGQR